MTNNLTSLDCLDAYGDALDCEGPVEYREAMSATATRFPRCEKHFEERLEVQRGIVSRYGGQMFYDTPDYGDDYDY